MAAPVVKNTGTYSSPSSSTSHTITLPSLSAGDVLLAIVSSVASVSITGADNWALVGGSFSSANIRAYAKRATGTETTITVTTDTSARISAIVYVLDGSANIGAPSIASGLTSPVNPSGAPAKISGADTTYICAGASPEGSSAASAPSGYTGLTNTSNAASGGVTLFSAHRSISASTSDNPGTFGFTPATTGWDAITIPVSDTYPIEMVIGTYSYTDATATTSREIYGYTTHPIGASGDTILVLLASNVAISSVTGYTPVGSANNGATYFSAYRKTASGSDTSIPVLTASGYVSAEIYLLRNLGAVSMATAVGGNTTPDPPSAAVTGTRANTISFAAFCTLYGSTLSISGVPTGYQVLDTNYGTVASNRALSVVTKLAAATTEDPTNFTKSTTSAWVAATLIAGYDSLTGGVSVTPTQGVVTLTGLHPTAYSPPKPGQGTLTFTGQTPKTYLGAVATQGGLTLSGQTPKTYLGSSPTQATLTLQGQQPSIASGTPVEATPIQATLTFTGQTPTVSLATSNLGEVTGNGFYAELISSVAEQNTAHVIGAKISAWATVFGGATAQGHGFTTLFSATIDATETAYVTGDGFQAQAAIVAAAIFNAAALGRGFSAPAKIYGAGVTLGREFAQTMSAVGISPESLYVSGGSFASRPTITAQSIVSAKVTGIGFISGILKGSTQGRSFTTQLVIKIADTTQFSEAFVLNLIPPTDNLYSISRYQNYPFSHLFRLDNTQYGVTHEGVYALEGTYDSTEEAPVSGTIKLNEDDLSIFNSKNIPYIYLNGEDDYEATAFVDDVEQPTFNSGFGGRRVRLARGSKGRYWYFRIRGIKSLYGVEYKPENLGRKVK